MNLDQYRVFFEHLLSIDCTTNNEYEIGETYRSFHEKNGDRVIVQEVEPKRNNIWALDPNPSKENRVLFSTHIDTVPPHLEWTHDKESDCYYGRGACDTKGGQVTQLMAGQHLREQGYIVDYLWVVGEEVNHIGAIKSVDYYQENLHDYTYKMIILCEPTDNRLAEAQKGILSGLFTFKGKMAHSGYPHLGDDANKKLIQFCSKMYDVADSMSDETYGSLDVNVGKIDAGYAANVVSDKAVMRCLSRTNSNHSAFKETLESLLEGDDMSVEWLSDNPPMLFSHVKDLEYSNTYVAKFNTDMKYLSAIAPGYLMGPGYIIHAHAPKEHIYWNDMLKGKELYIQLVKDVFK